MSQRLAWVGLVALVAGACVDAPKQGRPSPGEQNLGGAGEAGSVSVPFGDAGAGGSDDSAGAAGEPAQAQAGGSSDAGAAGQPNETAGTSGSSYGGSAGAPQGGTAGLGGYASGGSAGRGVAGAGGVSGGSGGQGGHAGSAGAGAGAGGKSCTCSVGACCDGCHPYPSTHLCASGQVRGITCMYAGLTGDIGKQFADLYCDGAETTTCTRWVNTTYSATSCPSNQVCNAPTGVAPYCGAPL